MLGLEGHSRARAAQAPLGRVVALATSYHSEESKQGTPTGSQAYSIRLPAKNALPPEVWFAATVFEGIAYPYHKMRVQSGDCQVGTSYDGAPCGMEMTR